MNLFFIRHMPTPDNRAGLLQGRRDTSILPPGPEDLAWIEKNKAVLGPLSAFDHILVSDLQRTHQTAALYTHLFVVDPLLNELDFGPFEGRPRQDLIQQHPQWLEDPSGLVLGESMTEFKERILAFADKYDTATRILAFGHGAWFRALASLWETGTLADMNRITIENNTLVTLGDKRRKA